jgi:Ca2+-binding RTX toxin-like protein
MKLQIAFLFLGMGLLHAEAFLGTGGDDTIQGGAGNDWIELLAGNDQGIGGAGYDVIFGGEGSDTLLGEEGHDILVGGGRYSHNDTAANSFEGGLGDDMLLGGIHGDIYHYGLGDGFDRIREPGTSAGAIDAVEFGAGITAGDIEFSRWRGNLFVSLPSGDILEVSSWFGSSQGAFRIEEFRFDADPTILGPSLAFDGTTWNGTSAGDTYTASGGANFWLLGGDGNDTLTGSTGLDVLVGGNGLDTLYGKNGADGLYGEDGNDTLRGESGDDVLDGGIGSDTLFGGTGVDELTGGAGDDILYGENGNDSYFWNPGDGNDTVQDTLTETEAGAVNRLVFGVGILPTNVILQTVSGSTTNLKFQVMDGTAAVGSVVINFWAMNHSYTATRHSKTWRIEFADGTIWDGGLLATPLNDVLHGTSGADSISGGEGSDTISGLDGNDTLDGDGGIDVIYGGNGDDEIDGGTGNDTLNGDSGADSLFGGEGNDVLAGGYGNDQLWGGPGNDALNGASGADIYHWKPGDGNDTIIESFGDLTTVNVLHINGLDEIGQLDFVPQSGYRLRIFIPEPTLGPAATIDIDFWSLYSSGYRFLQFWDLDLVGWGTFRFANLPTTGNDTASGTTQSDLMLGWDGNDNLSTGNGDDYLHGGAGNDTLSAGNGNDYLFGCGGNDTLQGGDGDDTYFVNAGGGSDRIEEPATQLPDESNGIVFGAGIDPTDVVISRSGDDLIIEYEDGTGFVTIAGWFADAARSSAIEFAKFENGIQWSGQLIEALVGYDPSSADPIISPDLIGAAVDNFAPDVTTALLV